VFHARGFGGQRGRSARPKDRAGDDGKSRTWRGEQPTSSVTASEGWHSGLPSDRLPARLGDLQPHGPQRSTARHRLVSLELHKTIKRQLSQYFALKTARHQDRVGAAVRVACQPVAAGAAAPLRPTLPRRVRWGPAPRDTTCQFCLTPDRAVFRPLGAISGDALAIRRVGLSALDYSAHNRSARIAKRHQCISQTTSLCAETDAI
jgi:hypothetical protein